MTINKHYEDELTYLRELGDVFSRENPRLAGFLSHEARDPDVERLLEGFAFLTARLRQRLDDELPEVAIGLLQLIWPHYLRPIPPTTIVTFTPAKAAVGKIVHVPKGTPLSSQPVQGVTCEFVTSYDTEVLPLKIREVELDNASTSAKMSLTIDMVGPVSRGALREATLRVHFATEREPHIGRALLLWLLRHVRAVRLEAGGGDPVSVPTDCVRPVGFGEHEAVLDYPANSFRGFRILQEYLTCPSKYLFVDVDCLKALPDRDYTSFKLVFETSRPFPEQVRLSERHFALNATPAINLFETDGRPLLVDRRKSEYRIAPVEPTHSIHRIIDVVGYRQGQGERILYLPFESFRHDRADQKGGRFYRNRLRPSVLRTGVDHYLAFVDAQERDIDPLAETVSLRLGCSNGALAALIPVGGVCVPAAGTPGTVDFRNIASVAAEVPPPIHDNHLWRLIANLARNFGSIIQLETLKTVIASYDFRALNDVLARRQLETLLEAIVGFSASPFDLFIDGRPIRSRRLTLEIAESKIGGEGEMFLFGAVMDAFLAAYAAINSHHILRVVGTESNAEYTWTPRTGTADPV